MLDIRYNLLSPNHPLNEAKIKNAITQKNVEIRFKKNNSEKTMFFSSFVLSSLISIK